MPAVFTSITLAYLAKARVLAGSVKRHAPDTTFYLVLAEPAPPALAEGIANGTEPFDELITDSDLDIPEHLPWMFEHDVVEACTALKGAALTHLQQRRQEGRVLYLDPDILVLSDLQPLFDLLEDHSILLTPHCPDAESELDPIVFNEISSLAHGVYNLGFLGVAGDAEGRRLGEWWWHRLYHFCRDDIPAGLFTDQRWADLVPAQFEGVRILRDPQYNAASWNITQRAITGGVAEGFRANGEELCFYHFSGANAGVPERMHDRLGIEARAVLELVEHYRELCAIAGEAEQAGTPWTYATYRDGTPITRAQRALYREDPSLRARFPDPFAVGPGSLLEHLHSLDGGLEGVEAAYDDSPEALRVQAARLRRIERTSAFKAYRRARSIGRLVRRRARR